MNTTRIIKTPEHEVELAPLNAKLTELRALKFGVNDFSQFERTKSDMESLRKRIANVNAKYGLFVDYNIINDDKDSSPDERYGSFAPRVTYTIGAGMNPLFAFAPASCTSCYDLHYWLVKIGAVTARTKHDHEYSGLYYYLSSETSARAFIDRINKAMKKVVKI